MVASKLRLVVLVMILGLLVAGAARGNYYDEVMDDSPVAYWRLNESSGTAVYDSAGSHNGTRSGTVTLGQSGALVGDPDTAMDFGGGHVVVPYAADLDGNTFSIECWAKPSSVGGGSWRSPVMYRWVDGSTSGPDCYGYNFYADATHENWEFWIGRGPAAGSFAVVNGPAAQLDKWTHLVGTYDGTTMRFYTDGRYRSSSVQAHGVLTTTSVPFEIGGGPRFAGDLDEMAVYDTALSAERVAAHYLAGKGIYFPGPAGQSLILHLDEGAGPTACDATAHHNDGTLQSGASWSTTAKFGNSMHFDGNTDYVSVPNSASISPTGGITLEGWFRVDQDMYDPVNNEYRFFFNKSGVLHAILEEDRQICFSLYADGPGYKRWWTGKYLPLDEWAHLACTYDADTGMMGVYINGVGLSHYIDGTGDLVTNSNPLFISNSSRAFPGFIDEFALYGRALSSDEILARYYGGPPVTPEPASLALLGVGLGLLRLRRRRR